MTLRCDFGLTTSPGVCRVRHLAAKVAKRREAKTGKTAGFNPCFGCPEIIEHIEKEKANVPHDYNPYIQGKCNSCGEERSIFRNSHICQKCLKKGKKATAAAPIGAEVPIELPKPIVLPPAPIRPKYQEPLPSVGTITIDLTRVPGLAENLLACAHLDIRSPEDQALVILRKALGVEP
jgi:ribosomal protein S14